jgi:hypothetical protein
MRYGERLDEQRFCNAWQVFSEFTKSYDKLVGFRLSSLVGWNLTWL